jgi:nitroimidazol reductase NimA-like FMN-containing flavoprotein (pyridoxamine 5'-phosphate oxidase superfamily)
MALRPAVDLYDDASARKMERGAMNDAEPVENDHHSSLVALNRDECVELLTSAPIGRVVFVDDGHPIALPVNYRWHHDAVVFRTLEGTVLHTAAGDAPVSFEVDTWDEHSHKGSSVVVRGTASLVTEWAEKAELEELGIVPWVADPWRQSWVRITPSGISGRRIT